MVTEIASSQNSYQLAFRDLQEDHRSERVSWLRRLRANAMDQFTELGFPSVKNEEWKYTNVAPIAAIDFKPSLSQTTAEGELETEKLVPFRCVETAQSELVFLNGMLRKDLSSLSAIPEEVVAMDLSEAIADERYRESVEAFHVATTAADLGANSSYNTTTINFGAKLSRHDVHVTMDNEGAECWVDGLYLVTTGQHTDTHSVIDHRQPHCTSHQLYKGILDGKSRAAFNGKIFVRHDAQKTDAMQTNTNLLPSNEARVDTKPQLENLADDVKCAHGAAVGQIDDEELFYLKARGIHPDLARNLLTYGFAEEVIGKIKIESIRAQLDEAVFNRLNARLEA